MTSGAGLVRSPATNSGRMEASTSGAGLVRSPATNSGRTEAIGFSSKVPAMLAALMPVKNFVMLSGNFWWETYLMKGRIKRGRRRLVCTCCWLVMLFDQILILLYDFLRFYTDGWLVELEVYWMIRLEFFLSLQFDDGC